MRPQQSILTRTLALGTLAGLAGIGYAAGYEVRAFTLRHVEMPVLPPGSAPLKVLHLSDMHMTPTQRKKQRWVRELAALEPDLVVNTGDNLAHTLARVTALSPAATLQRGYAVLQTDAGAVVRRPADVAAGDRLRARLAEGELAVQVTGHQPAGP